MIALLMIACIPKGKYDAMVAERDQLADEIRRSNATLAQLEEVERELRQQVAQLTAAVEQQRAMVAAKERELDQKRRELATMAAEAGNLASSVEQMQQALKELEERRAKAEANLREFRDLVARFKSMIDAGTLTVKVVDGRMVVQLATDILFAAGSARLSKEGKAALTEVAGVLASIPDRDFQVAGHTDDQPISTAAFPSNWYLGAGRAIAVSEILVEGGMSAERVSAASYAEFRPADTNRTPEGRANNRRIEIIIVPDLSQMPGFEELQGL